MFEELLDNINNWYTKWDDTIFKLANEDGTTGLKIDMKKIFVFI